MINTFKDNRPKLVEDILDEISHIDDGELEKILKDISHDKYKKRKLGELLLINARITPEQLREAIEIQSKQKERKDKLGDILLRKKYIEENDIYNALAMQLSIPYLNELNVDKINLDLIKKVPIHFAKKYKIIPLEIQDDKVIVACEDPMNCSAADDLRVLLEKDIKMVISKSSTIIDTINKAYDKATTTSDVMEELDDNLESFDLEESKDLLETDDEAPIIRLVNSLISRAVKEGASDIHIEPFEKDILVRFRVDGVLYDILKPPKRYQASITSRIKVMGQLNIAEKRLPQDGRIKIKMAGKDIDIRLSTLPTSHGERIVMRLLDRSSILLDLKDIGFDEKTFQKVMEIIGKPHGIFLVTGPTGSGKTTTLYSCLSKIYSPEKNIITVEDPVEYELHGVGQIQVNPKIDLTFASGLRSILRQDPDIIMIGEIRDTETAEIAIQASLTGHFVFSTVHTNDAAGAITRLVDMNIERFLIASSLEGILAQRLAKKVCKICAKKVTPGIEELSVLNLKPSDLKEGFIYKAVGCKECGETGYRGRIGIYELLPIDDAMRSEILKNPDSVSIKRAANARGMRLLRDAGASKVAEGVTTIEEILKVTQMDTTIE